MTYPAAEPPVAGSPAGARRLRILLVTVMPPSPHGHGAIPLLLHATLRALEQHSVTLVTVAGPEPCHLEAVEELRASGVEVLACLRREPSGLERWRRRWRLSSGWLRDAVPFRTVWFYEPAIQSFLDRLLAERAFDIIQAEDNAMGVYRYGARVPALLVEYEVRRPRAIDWQAVRRDPIRGALREGDWRHWAGYQPAVWSKFARIQVFTERDAGLVRDLAPALAPRVVVNPFSVEPSPLADPACQERDLILLDGDFSHPPNVDAAEWLVEEILPLARARYPGVRLLLAGSHFPDRLLRLQSNEISVVADPARTEPLLERAALYVAPIRIGNGMRMKVLRAMAAGKAVVTTPRGAEGLTIAGDAPPLALAEDVPGLAAAVVRLLSDPGTRDDLGRRAREHVARHFSPEAYGRRLEAIYTGMIAEREPGRRTG